MPSGGRATQFGDNCIDCGVLLTIGNGILNGHNVKRRCRKCENIRASQRPSRANGARKDQYLKWKFGISREEYNRKLELQLRGCAICRQPCNSGRELAVDHNHRTEEIRDLLCAKCNGILGLANDDEEILFACIEYLKRHTLKNAI